MWAIIPVKALNNGKSRLAIDLPARAREALVKAMLLDMLSTLARCPAITRTVIVSRCPQAAHLAQKMSIPVLNLSADRCLNSGITATVNELTQRGIAEVMVLHSDLPLIRTEDIATAVNAQHTGIHDITLVPDNSSNGTNAMLLNLPTTMRFAYGQNSFSRHRQLAHTLNLRTQILHNARIGSDIDFWSDVASLKIRQAQQHLTHWLEQYGELCGWHNATPPVRSLASA